MAATIDPLLFCRWKQVLQPGDVIIHFDGIEVADDGTILFEQAVRIDFEHLVSMKFDREGKPLVVRRRADRGWREAVARGPRGRATSIVLYYSNQVVQYADYRSLCARWQSHRPSALAVSSPNALSRDCTLTAVRILRYIFTCFRLPLPPRDSSRPAGPVALRHRPPGCAGARWPATQAGSAALARRAPRLLHLRRADLRPPHRLLPAQVLTARIIV